jgi:hypothetical protein
MSIHIDYIARKAKETEEAYRTWRHNTKELNAACIEYAQQNALYEKA